MQLTHIDKQGKTKMVDVSAKPVSQRKAVARGSIFLEPCTIALIESNEIAKGDVLNTARIAGIQAAKRTGELIPLCHPLNLTHVDVDLDVPADKNRIEITATTKISAQTGVEMEALTAVQIALLTVYDMCKAVDRGMTLGEIRLLEKSGGKSGTWKRQADPSTA